MSCRRAAGLLGVVALAATLFGCGRTQAVGSDHLIQLGLTEYRLIPQSITVGAGQVTIYAHNYGRLNHNLVVSDGGQTAGSTDAIRPGQSAELILTLSPGKYMLASTILTDRGLGTYGTLTVSR